MQRRPLDVRIAAALMFALGCYIALIALTVLLGLARKAPTSPDEAYGLFELAGLRSAVWDGIEIAVSGAAWIVAGYGVLRLRAYGWWAALGVFLYEAVLLCVNWSCLSTWWLPSIVLDTLLAIWLLLRARLFNPASVVRR